ncbi:MAG: AmmeMemoRadiSam system protein A [Lachnospiraceae bacterium]|nr:AmmeMemoRadiSam system protein A [Lachnospiraceae bacterium]
MKIKGAFMVPHPPIIIPEIGKGQEKEIQTTIDGYKRAAKEIVTCSPDTIVLVSPHSIMYADYFHISPGKWANGDLGKFRAPQVAITVDYDEELAAEIGKEAKEKGIAAGTLGERDPRLDHGSLVPLYFIKEAYGGKIPCKIIRIGLSGFSFAEHYKLGMVIQKAAERLHRNTVFVASGDMSHRLKEDGPYGFKKEGPEYDAKLMTWMEKADFLPLLTADEQFCEIAGECGHRSLCMMAGALDGYAVNTERISYEGPFGVGYGICSFYPEKPDESRHFLKEAEEEKRRKLEERKANEDAYVKLARLALETYITEGKKLKVSEVSINLPDEMIKKQAGTFVSLKKDGSLRGCIGTIAATKSCIAEEIIDNAIKAAVSDPRFSPVEKDELQSLVYSVDVLGEAEKISSKDELDVKRYGVIVTKGYRRGLLLPNLDGIDTVEEQIRIAKQKAGIEEEETVEMERFEVVRHY